MQKAIKIYALLLIVSILSGCALFNRKTKIVHVEEKVFIVEDVIKDYNVNGIIITLVNPFFPDDKAIIISGEKFKKVMGSAIENITEKDLKKAIEA